MRSRSRSPLPAASILMAFGLLSPTGPAHAVTGEAQVKHSVDAREVRERGERGERGFGDERERRRERVRVGFEGEKASGKDVRARGAADGVRDERARGSRVRRRRGRRRSRVGRENGE